MQFKIRQDIITGVCRPHIKSNAVYVEIYVVTLTIGYLWILGISSCENTFYMEYVISPPTLTTIVTFTPPEMFKAARYFF